MNSVRRCLAWSYAYALTCDRHQPLEPGSEPWGLVLRRPEKSPPPSTKPPLLHQQFLGKPRLKWRGKTTMLILLKNCMTAIVEKKNVMFIACKAFKSSSTKLPTPISSVGPSTLSCFFPVGAGIFTIIQLCIRDASIVVRPLMLRINLYRLGEISDCRFIFS